MFDGLFLNSFRCFRGARTIPLERFTILVGENSTGKSSFLAAVRAAWSVAHGHLPDFNEEPFHLGAFNQIANYVGGNVGRSKSFEIGCAVQDFKITGTFSPARANPELTKWSLEAFDLRLESRDSGAKGGGSLTLYSKGKKAADIDARIPLRFLVQDPSYFDFVLRHSSASKRQGLTKSNLSKLVRAQRVLQDALRMEPTALAPIRTSPKRTYDPIKDIPEPQGGHVPMVLARTIADATSAQARRLLEGLEAYGRACGLFDTISVRQLRGEGSPFQVLVKVHGPPKNLVDVGYGVSQALPILVDALRGGRQSLLLLQQPEVHLHPRAQAELGTFLYSLAQVRARPYIIETHSDYFLDRVRQEARRAPREDTNLLILYFERVRGDVRVHPMRVNSRGDFEHVPETYRSFFLREERAFLGLD